MASGVVLRRRPGPGHERTRRAQRAFEAEAGARCREAFAARIVERRARAQETLGLSLTSLIGIAGPLVVTAAFAATQKTWPGGVWFAAAAFYLLALPLLFSRRARDA